jgi:hypothetical protein
MADMRQLSNSYQDPGAETSSVEAVAPISPEFPSQVYQSGLPSHGSDALSSDKDEIESGGVGYHYLEEHCSYEDQLQSQHLNINETWDYFLLEHITSDHRTGCNSSWASSADEILQVPPIREEVPFDQVACLQPVSLTDELLSPRHIRLLELYTRTSADSTGESLHVRERTRILCKAYQASLDDLTTTGQPLFAAASYVCGDQTPVQQITCGGDIIEIPQNAYDVLCHLRFRNRPRLIWIDYLCIRQDDAREKSHQVGMLHAIYAQAHVVSWLGTAHGIDLQNVTFYLTLFARLWTDEVRMPESGPTISHVLQRVMGRLEKYLESQTEKRPLRYSLSEIASIFAAEYFTRVWIFQEIILGKTNVCQFGDQLYSLAVLTAAAQVLGRCGTRQPTTLNPECIKIDVENIERVVCSHLQPALHGRWHQTSRSRPHDVEVVTELNLGSCLDPRDYIYGVASLFLESDLYGIDYALSESEVFADFTAHCLSSDQDIGVLNQDRLAMESACAYWDPRPGLPSWCPDWSIAGGGNGVLFEESGFDWQASGDRKFVYSRPSRVTLAPKGLVVSRLKLCSNSILNRLDGGELWFEHSKRLRAFFESQGLKVDNGTRDIIFRIFERMFKPEDLKDLEGLGWDEVSYETRLFVDQVHPSDLVALLVPVYLATADPELFEVMELGIDPRLPSKDHSSIRDVISNLIAHYGHGIRLFVTEDGMQGAGYPGVRSGDLVCIIYGSDVPQILRQVDTEDDDHYILVGACNVDGLMYGEGLEMGLTEREFILV